MLCFGWRKQIIYWLLQLACVLLSLCHLAQSRCVGVATATATNEFPDKQVLLEKTLQMLHKLERRIDAQNNDDSSQLEVHTKFTLLLAEFLIKQKVRFCDSTRYDEQIYFHLLHKLNSILQKSENSSYYGGVHQLIMDNIFQKNVLPLAPSAKLHHIDTHFEYKSLLNNYEQLVDSGFPNSTLSDACLAEIASMEKCNLSSECLSAIVSDLPTYGYQRMHQILLLYVFQHHSCAPSFGSGSAFEILASQRCTQAFREQNVIRARGIPPQYRDLYLEQLVICGLFGYVEFLDWRHMAVLMSWQNVDGCYCLAEETPAFKLRKLNCDCSNHLNSLALVYYVNGILMLDDAEQ